ncbi:CUB and sushi domain-containing protein 2-like [Saccostrea cucullata]|uniref:CUB and sushi domain-containing protein 2-like n=1 Tax=Saccostrea cuccullata TaxID=36930 RepID=UPI002ED12295
MIKAPKHCRVNGTHGNYSCNIGPQGMLHVSESLTCECNTGFHLKSGDLERTCLHGGTWSGSEPMCIASGSCMCPCDRVTNPSYTSPNDEALLKEIQRMKQELLILKNITNKALRKRSQSQTSGPVQMFPELRGCYFWLPWFCGLLYQMCGQ